MATTRDLLPEDGLTPAKQPLTRGAYIVLAGPRDWQDYSAH